MNLIDKLKANLKANVEASRRASQFSREEVHDVEKLLANLSWFDTRESELHFSSEGIRALIFETLPGPLGRPALRIRLAEGNGETISDAIEDAAAILRTQEGTDDDATGHK